MIIKMKGSPRPHKEPSDHSSDIQCDGAVLCGSDVYAMRGGEVGDLIANINSDRLWVGKNGSGEDGRRFHRVYIDPGRYYADFGGGRIVGPYDSIEICGRRVKAMPFGDTNKQMVCIGSIGDDTWIIAVSRLGDAWECLEDERPEDKDNCTKKGFIRLLISDDGEDRRSCYISAYSDRYASMKIIRK